MFNIKEKAILSGLLVSVLISFTGFSGRCQKISEKVLRLHVLANSDSQDDQDLKLKVRDKILKSCGEYFGSSKNLEEAMEIAKINIPLVLEEAKNEILSNGYNYDVKAEIVRMNFNTRNYGQVVLPAGRYYAVRVTIGEGKGRNWWCVMFPPMCLPAAQEKKELEDVLNPDEVDIVEGGQKYEIKFKLVEIFEGIREWFSWIFSIMSPR